MSIIIDQEFKSLIPPLSEEEFKQLEENCVREGIRDALIVWPQGDGNYILLDGHNRWEISVRYGGIRFQTKTMEFSSRDEAMMWIIKNQFGRRNLSAYDRSILALKLKPVIAEKAKERQDLGLKSDEGSRTDVALGKIAGVGKDTIRKVEVIEKSDNNHLKKQVRAGDISINQGYMIAKGIQDKSPAQSKKEFIQEVKKERKDFKDKKVVGLADIKADKENKKILKDELYLKLLRIGKPISDIWFDISEGETNLAELSKEFSQDERNNLILSISKWIEYLNVIMEVIKSEECHVDH